MLLQHLHQARFTNARLAAEEHHLPEAVLDLRPAFQQEPDFLLPAHEWGPPSAAGRFEATASHALIEYPIDRERLRLAFEERSPQRLAGKEAPEQLEGGGADHQGVGRGKALQAGRQVGRLPERQLFLPGAVPYLPHHHQPGMNAQAHRELPPALAF
jgi:hypothetical protein